MSAAIIGGGIAGLTAAYELVKAGERPLFIEPGEIGGMVRTQHRDGFTLELGPNVLVGRPDLHELLNELGLLAEIVYPSVNPYGQYVWYKDRAVKVPAKFLALLASPLFTLKTKALLPFRAVIPGILPGASEDCSVEEFFKPLLGFHTARHLLDPVLKGIYGGDVANLSVRSIFPALWTAGQHHQSLVGYMRSRRSIAKPPILVVRGGIHRITEALWSEVGPKVDYLKAKALRISPLDGKRYRISLDGERHIEADGCLVTVAGNSLSSLVGHLDEELSNSIQNTKYATLAVAHLRVPRTEPLIKSAFGVLFPGGMPEDLLGVMFNSLIFPHVAPADQHIVTVVLGGAQAGGKIFEEQVLRKRVPGLLKDLLNISSAQWISLTQWPAAIPQFAVGHHRLVAKLDECEHRFPGVVFAGVDRGGVGVSDRIRMSKEAIRRFRRVRVETVA